MKNAGDLVFAPSYVQVSPSGEMQGAVTLRKRGDGWDELVFEVRREERRACAEAICEYCRVTRYPERNDSGGWWHTLMIPPTLCLSGAIWERQYEEGEPWDSSTGSCGRSSAG